jgi:prepilin-type N-terminal cleavage/methylation domain-containing protein
MPGDGGFTIIESMVAVTILSLAIVVTIQPLIGAIRRISDARVVGVAENLAQGELESIRALDYEDIGIPGRTPSGVLTASREVTVEGRTYSIETMVSYAGSVTGLNVIPQGGDGVQGTWDPGVDYKVVTITVIGTGREMDPVVMETIVSPPRVGAHEGIANARITVVPYEPFAPSRLTLPTVKITAAPAPSISSPLPASTQVFPAIPVATYTVTLATANGWVIHPDDVLAHADLVTVSAGSTTDTSIRLYRPASLTVTVRDYYSQAAITTARVTLTRLPTGAVTVGTTGQYQFTGLIPDAYDIRFSASGYNDLVLTSVNLPSGYPDDMSHELSVVMQPLAPPTTTTTTTTQPGATTTTTVASTTTTTLAATVAVSFTVTDNTARVVAGATVTVDHPSRGTLESVTDIYGLASLNLEGGTTFTATATTPWGHGAVSANFNPASQTAVNLELTQPNSKGTMTLIGGSGAELLYSGGGPWVAMPANYQGEASFVAGGGWYDVAMRCLSGGAVKGQKQVSMKVGKNRETAISGNCP